MQVMTPHEINLAIGKSLGFAQCPTAICQGFPPELCYRKDTYIGELPDFYNSLDRMHEVERSFDEEQWLDYIRYLQEDVLRCFGNLISSKIAICHSTSQQRAEAYLRTLNLWTNTKDLSLQDATVNNPPPSM